MKTIKSFIRGSFTCIAIIAAVPLGLIAICIGTIIYLGTKDEDDLPNWVAELFDSFNP